MTQARRLSAALPWLFFALALVLAAEPIWRIPLLGLDPSLDELLQIRCLSHP